MSELSIPLLLYSGERKNANFSYFSGVDAKLYDYSFLLVEGKKRTLIVSEMNEMVARNEFKGTVCVYWDLKKKLKEILRGRRIGVDESSLSVREYRRIRRYCKPKDVSEELLRIRAKKKPEELSRIKKAVELSKKIINSVDFGKCKKEEEVAKYLLRETAELGLEPAFTPIVASGPHTAFPHYLPREYKLQKSVLIDYGIKYRGYCGDITRMVMLEKGPWVEDYELVKQITHEIVDFVSEAENSGEVSKFAQKLYVKYKLPKLPHAIGHGIGLDVHEFPGFGMKGEHELKNTAFTIEPGIYRKNWGVRFEECVYFDGKKASVLS